MRRWILQILGLILLAAFLTIVTWLIYDYQIHKLENQRPTKEMKP